MSEVLKLNIKSKSLKAVIANDNLAAPIEAEYEENSIAKEFEKKFIELLNLKYKKILNQIKEGKLTDEITSTLEKVASELTASYE